jgi:hypothetical protein
MINARPDVIILLYVFNDIDYLSQVTHREGQSEAPKTVFERLEPTRLLYKNSYLFQELYVRVRLLSYSSKDSKDIRMDPYSDRAVIDRHMQDLLRFVSMARGAAAQVFIVPFDISVNVDANVRLRYKKFIADMMGADIPTWSADEAFSGHVYDDLTVNILDRHPNELANDLLAEALVGRMASAIRGNIQAKRSAY